VLLTPGVDPALDDLDALQLRRRVVDGAGLRAGVGAAFAARVLHRHHREARAARGAGGTRLEVGAHGDAALVARLDEVGPAAEVPRQVPAGEEADDGAGAAGGVGLAPPHGLEDGIARVLFGPRHGQGPGVEGHLREKAFGTGAGRAVKAHEVHLVGAARSGVVGVGAADEAELERIGPEFGLLADAVLEHVAQIIVERGRLVGARVAAGGELEVLRLELLEAALGILGAGAGPALGAPFALMDLGERLPERAQARVGGRVLLDHVELAHAQVAVMGDGEDVAAVAGVEALLLQPRPQQPRVVAGVEVADRQLRDLGVAEDDVAVQVGVVRHRGPLVADERGEPAGRLRS
jgi:hypothetical protein